MNSEQVVAQRGHLAGCSGRGRPVYRSLFTLHVLLGALASGLTAQQQDPLTHAFDLERRGSFAAAVDVYKAVLQSRPAEVAALLGLERCLTPLNRLLEILPPVRTAMAAAPTNGAIYGVAVRAWSAADQPDSLRRVVERWAQAVPGDETPYREWGSASLARRDRLTAKKAYLLARERLGQPQALAAELAQLAALDEDYATATKEWLAAIRRLPGYRSSAIAALSQIPELRRPDVLRALDREDGIEAKRMAVDLRARWGDAEAAFKLLLAILPPNPPQAVDMLQQFLDGVRSQGSRESLRAQGMTLEALGERMAPQQRDRVRLDAARAYLDAGDRASARRMLSQIAGESGTSEVALGAATTLIRLLVDDGSVEEAARRLEQYQTALPAEDFEGLRRTVARGWVRVGRLDRAEALIANDSTVEGFALSARFALYRGDLAAARTLLQAAGPFAGSREESTERAHLLALLQPIETDSLPPLGAGFLRLDQGDTAAAVTAFDKIGGGLAPEAGGAELRLLAGRLEVDRRRVVEAERYLKTAAGAGVAVTAAAAELELGSLYLSLEREPEAAQVLEHLILNYPESALVPQARRLLDVARGAVPKT